MQLARKDIFLEKSGAQLQMFFYLCINDGI